MIRKFDDSHPVTRSLVTMAARCGLACRARSRPDPTGRRIAPSRSPSWPNPRPPHGANSAIACRARTSSTPKSDLKGPQGVAVSSERVSPSSLPLSVPGGRLVVIGTGDVFSNQRLADQGCQGLSLNAINWAVDRDTQLHFPPRPVERFQMSLSREQLARLRLGLLFALPGAVGLLGMLVYWTRRR